MQGRNSDRFIVSFSVCEEAALAFSARVPGGVRFVRMDDDPCRNENFRVGEAQEETLSGCHKITEEGFAAQRRIVPKDFKMSEAKISYKSTDEDFANLGKQKSLRRIYLSGCYNITIEGFAHLRKLKNLNTLCLSECFGITDEGLKKLPCLVHLDLSWCFNITDKVLENLKNLKIRWCDNITDTGLAHLAGLKKLETLDLSKCKITNAGLAHLKNLKILI